MSWPLRMPTLGPAFQLGFSDPLACGRPSAGRKRTVVLPESDIERMRKNMVGLSIVGYYFPTPWREFVRRGHDGEWWINLLHPNAQAVKPLRVIMATPYADLSGVIGLEAFPFQMSATDDTPAFFVSTATGNLRRDEQGELLGDQLLCVYPQPDLDQAHIPTLNFALPAPAYQVDPDAPGDDDVRIEKATPTEGHPPAATG